MLGVILNKVKTEEGLPAFVDSLKQHLPLLGSADFQLLGAIPFSEELNALRTRDIAELLGAQVLNAGGADQRRVNKIVLCARAVPNTVQLLRSGVLVVTPGDRDDIILAASLASLNGEARRTAAVQRLRAGPAHPRAVQGRAGRRPAGDDR